MAATSSTPSSTRGSTQTRSPRPTAQVSAPRSARRIKTVRAAAAIPVQAACTAAIRRRAFATTSPQGRALRPPTLPPPAADEHGVFRRYLRDTGVGNRRRTRSTAPHPGLVSGKTAALVIAAIGRIGDTGVGNRRRTRSTAPHPGLVSGKTAALVIAAWGYRRWESSPYAEYGSSSRLGLAWSAIGRIGEDPARSRTGLDRRGDFGLLLVASIGDAAMMGSRRRSTTASSAADLLGLPLLALG